MSVKHDTYSRTIHRDLPPLVVPLFKLVLPPQLVRVEQKYLTPYTVAQPSRGLASDNLDYYAV